MMSFSVGRFPRGYLVRVCVLLAATSPLLLHGEASVSVAPLVTSSPKRPPVVPSLSICCDGTVAYLGVYSADGKYRPYSGLSRWYNRDSQDPVIFEGTRPKDVPAWADLHPRERVLENLEPRKRATKPLKAPTGWSRLRDNIITAVYGHEEALLAPRDVTTDSRGRVIAVDPTASAVHVLDGEHSFRLLAGSQRRLLQPNDVAVDADDNIYVSDSERGLVVVYDPEGRFLRYIGQLGRDESLFHDPTGIAIDRDRERLYVLDSLRHELFILDLKGNVIKRVGRSGGNTTAAEFEFPTEIAIRDQTVAVLDAGGSRVILLDLDGHPSTHFNVAPPTRHGIVTEMGLALDGRGRVFVSNIGGAEMRVFDQAGRCLQIIGKPGHEVGAFLNPGGVWIDASDRMFVSDTTNRRVQVFQLKDLASK